MFIIIFSKGDLKFFFSFTTFLHSFSFFLSFFPFFPLFLLSKVAFLNWVHPISPETHPRIYSLEVFSTQIKEIFNQFQIVKKSQKSDNNLHRQFSESIYKLPSDVVLIGDNLRIPKS